MNAAFSEARHTSNAPVARPVGLRDHDDEQVLLDALEAGATHLVTENVRDFVSSALRELPVLVMTGDDFLLSLITLHGANTISVVMDDWRASRSAPAQSRVDIVALLKRQTWVEAALALERAWS